MYWILFVMAAIVAVILALIVGGLATPRQHAVARTMIVPATVDEIWRTIRDVARYDEWRHELDAADVVDSDQPQPRWRETTSRGSITFGMTTDDPPRRMAARMLDDDLPYAAEWTWQIEPESSGTRVTLTERGSVGNPISRFVRAHFIGHWRSIDRYMQSLAARHGVHRIEIQDAAPA